MQTPYYFELFTALFAITTGRPQATRQHILDQMHAELLALKQEEKEQRNLGGDLARLDQAGD